MCDSSPIAESCSKSCSTTPNIKSKLTRQNGTSDLRKSFSPVADESKERKRQRDSLDAGYSSGEEHPGMQQPGKSKPGKEQPDEDQPAKEEPVKEQPAKEQPSEEGSSAQRTTLLLLTRKSHSASEMEKRRFTDWEEDFRSKSTPCDTSTAYRFVTPNTLMEMITTLGEEFTKKFILIDCRYDYEYSGGHVKVGLFIHSVGLLGRNYGKFPKIGKTLVHSLLESSQPPRSGSGSRFLL
uniref:protein-tyrosine-phosphatase n=1 Tax=Caenorhabditis tropicalis TaxID=1561998 RepID=A0A1I7T1Z4_9PELO